MITGLVRHRVRVGCSGRGEHGKRVASVRHKMEGNATRWKVVAWSRVPSYINVIAAHISVGCACILHLLEGSGSPVGRRGSQRSPQPLEASPVGSAKMPLSPQQQHDHIAAFPPPQRGIQQRFQGWWVLTYHFGNHCTRGIPRLLGWWLI